MALLYYGSTYYGYTVLPQGRRLAFARFEARALVPAGAAFCPRWVSLLPTEPRTQRPAKYYPSVLVSVALFHRRDRDRPRGPMLLPDVARDHGR